MIRRKEGVCIVSYMDICMYVYIYIFSDLLRKRDSFLRDSSLKKGSIGSYEGAWERFREFHGARTLRVGDVDLSYSPTAPKNGWMAT